MKPTTHGGPRTGAGRKRSGAIPKERTSFTINAALLDEVRRLAAARHVSTSTCIEAALYAYIEQSKP
jgi:predicted DNA-binding ribbon-helix-helix protein